MSNAKTRVVACETQPVTAAGLQCLLDGVEDLAFTNHFQSLPRPAVLDADVVLIDKTFGLPAVLSWLAEAGVAAPRLSAAVWGSPITEPEALRCIQAGARGILSKTASAAVVLSCLRSVARGQAWMEESVYPSMSAPNRPSRSELTPRERQVMELVEQGFRNRDIASALGIRPGTVKIHMKHIFEKTGVRGRYGLALQGLRQKGMLFDPSPAMLERIIAIR